MQTINDKDILFIINPHSGSRKAKKVAKEIRAFASDISFIVTNNLSELDKAFKSNIEKYKVFIVVGGDGTVNEALKYLYERNDKLFGVLPAGSGNGFSRELGFKKSVKSLIEVIKKGETINIDLLAVNNYKCINVAGIGLDSFVAHLFEQSTGRGPGKYILSVVKGVLLFKPFHATLTMGEKVMKNKFLMIAIANTRQFGNNAFIAPQAKPNDGLFEVVLIKPFPFYFYPVFVVRLFLGSLKDGKYIKYFEVDQTVEIESDFKKYHVDGVPRIFSDKLCIKMTKNKIRVIKTANNNI